MNNIGRILWNLPDVLKLKSSYKKIKNHSKKLISQIWLYKFHKICLNDTLKNIYIHKNNKIILMFT